MKTLSIKRSALLGYKRPHHVSILLLFFLTALMNASCALNSAKTVNTPVPTQVPTTPVDTALRSAIYSAGLQVPDDLKLEPVLDPETEMYSLELGSLVFHVSEDGSFSLHGNRLDLTHYEQATEQDKEKIRRETLPLIQADTLIVYPAETQPAKHIIIVFVDANCGFCAEFHSQIDLINAAGIDVHYLAFPREGLDTQGHWLNSAVWCNESPQQTLTEALEDIPIDLESCEDPVELHYALGESLGISATPAIIFPDGRLHHGVLSVDELLAKLKPQNEN
ncbi:MAG: DsbC family protein [Pseudomonadota bacterium]